MSLYFKFKTFYLKEEEEEVGKPYAFICHLPSRKKCKNIYIHREYIYMYCRAVREGSLALAGNELYSGMGVVRKPARG